MVNANQMDAPSNPTASRELRVVLLLDSLDAPAWVHAMLCRIQRINNVRIVLAVLPVGEQVPSPRPDIGELLRKLVSNRHSLLYDAWVKLDRRVYPVPLDAGAAVNCEKILSDCQKLFVKPLRKDCIDILADDDVARISEAQPDVILALGFDVLHGKILQVPRYGIWSLRNGDRRVIQGGPLGVCEVIEREATIGISLQTVREENDGGLPLYESFSPTDYSGSINRNRNNYYWKAAQIIPRVLSRLAENQGSVFPPPDAQVYCPDSMQPCGTPRNRDVIKLAGKTMLTKLSNRIRMTFGTPQWFIAYRKRQSQLDPNNVFHRFTHLIPPKDRFWADPFPVHYNGRSYLFLEEMPFSTKRGVIAACELLDDGTWSQPVVVVERPYHLSYPCVFQWKGTFYMVPESSAGSTVELWRSTEFPYKWEFDSFIMENVHAVDSTFFEHQGKLWMFTCMFADGLLPFDELSLFHASDVHGPWTPHPANPVVSDARCARPAGFPFWWHGRLMRPSQDCTVCYGRRMMVREIVTLSETEYEEQDGALIEPKWARGIFATHTLNMADDLTVIDACRWRLKF